jgi:hypothetical protein
MSRFLRLAFLTLLVESVSGTSLRKKRDREELLSPAPDFGVTASDEHRHLIAGLLDLDDDINIRFDDSSLWDCLMDGYDKESCKANSNGDCVFCAEPAYGLCVTPNVAEQLSRYPIFDCDLASFAEHK